MRQTFAGGIRTSLHVVRDPSQHPWSDLIAAADVVVPSIASGASTLLQVMATGRPVVAPVSPTTMRLVVPATAGLVYRPGDVSAMAGALLRLLTTPALRHGMACRAREVARRHHDRPNSRQPIERNEHA
jgi:glycosyltransferase involved in cell wall biosynthesis